MKKYYTFLKNCFLINLFYLFYQNKFYQLVKKINYEKKFHKKSILIELQFHNILLSTIYIFIAKILHRNFKIIFFYYSPFDDSTNNNVFSSVNFILFRLLKKLSNCEIINFYQPSSSKDKKDANKIFKKIKNLKNKNQLIKIKYKNVLIGKYINQSYCRELLKVKIDAYDPNLEKYILQAVSYVNFLNRFFKLNKIDKIFISHSIFIRYGILCRVAYANLINKIYIVFPRTETGFLEKISILRISGPEFLQIERFWLYGKRF